MADETKLIPFPRTFWEPAPEEKPVDLEKLNEQYKLTHPHMKAEELIGEKFTIFGAEAIQSSYDDQEKYFFCHCVDLKDKEIFTTTLGGRAVVDIIDRIVELKIKSPFTVTLDFIRQGAHDGYYIFR